MMKSTLGASLTTALRRTRSLALSGLMMAGCTGQLGAADKGHDNDNDPLNRPRNEKPDPVGMDEQGNEIRFSRPEYKCDADAIGDALPLRKLTNTQYHNTVLDLFRWALGRNDVSDIQTTMAPAFANLPEEKRDTSVDVHGTFRRLDQALQDEHVERSYEIAVAIGKKAATDHMNRMLNNCPSSQPASCIRDFIRNFGARALRRPLDDAEVSFYEGFYGNLGSLNQDAFADLVAGFLTAPQFLYTVEHGDVAVAGKNDLYALSAHELAARLSYHFIQSMPDDDLWQKAQSGALLDPDEYERQLDRLLDDERARRSTAEFYADFYRLDTVPNMNINIEDPKYQTFLSGMTPPSSMLKQAMIDDVIDMMQHYTWTVEGGYDDVLLSDLSFAASAELANIYGVQPWNKMGGGEPVVLPDGQRPGLFTRAAMLATSHTGTRPIHKGFALRSGILCDHIPPPPDNAANVAQDTENKTSRETVELITEQDGTSCKGCHEQFINHLGYPTESFDALGRHRQEEMLFGHDGAHTGSRRVNTKSQPRVFPGDHTEVSDALGLAHKIADSGKAHACMARNYFRFTFARMEDWNSGLEYENQTSRDGCVLERLRRAVDDKGGSLRNMVREIALAPEFKQRLIVQ